MAKLNKKNDLYHMDTGVPIQMSRATWMVAEPWKNPAAFSRVWCLNECYMTVKFEKEFELIMSADNARDFERSLIDEFDTLARIVSEVNLQRAQATENEDRVRIFRVIEDSKADFLTVNQLVVSKLREWFAKTGRAALERLRPEEQDLSPLINNVATLLLGQGKFQEAHTLLQRFCAAVEKYGPGHHLVGTALNNLARLLYIQVGYFRLG